MEKLSFSFRLGLASKNIIPITTTQLIYSFLKAKKKKGKKLILEKKILIQFSI
jgi:hypothetical protein